MFMQHFCLERSPGGDCVCALHLQEHWEEETRLSGHCRCQPQIFGLLPGTKRIISVLNWPGKQLSACPSCSTKLLAQYRKLMPVQFSPRLSLPVCMKCM